MRGEFVEVGPGRIYYYAAGTRGAGDPVILVHGFPTSSRLWHGVVRDFVPGHRLIVADLPGYGRSDPPHANGVSSAAHASALRGLCEVLGVARAVFVGHGLGGAAVQGVMAQWPHLVSGAVLVSCPAAGAKVRGIARFARALGPLAKYLPPGLLAGLVHGSVRRGFADPERSRLTLDSCLHSFTTNAGREALVAHLASLATDDTSQWITGLTSFTHPTAILWGSDDPFLPPSVGATLRQLIAGATLDIVDGGMHFIPEDAPDRVKKAIESVLERTPKLPPAA